MIGITDFAQGELGDIVYLDINTVGQDVKNMTYLAPWRR